MATVNSSAIFPSVKFISTDGSGDLDEVVAEPAVQASLTHDGLTFTAVPVGVEGNSLAVIVEEDQNASGLSFSAQGNHVTLTAESADAVSATHTYQGLTFSAVTGGTSGNSLTLEVRQGQAGVGVVGVEFSVSGSDIVMSAELALENYTQGDIEGYFASAPTLVTDLVDLSVADSGASLVNGTQVATNFTGGVNAVTIASYTQGQVETAFAGADSSVTDLMTLSIADGTANLLTTLSQTHLSGGTDAIASTLEADAKYVLIKQTDLHDLADDEVGDGRKLVWGFVHKASEVFAGLSDAPDNFSITKGTFVPIEGGTALRQNYTISAIYGINNLDLKAEA